ncbi:MAG: ATPase [Gemmatimonadota bacterium]|nr:MAG: ATPase [Gemmatimonadota bacterium]
MPPPELPRHPWVRALLLFLVCTFAGLFFGTQLHSSTTAWGSPTTLEWAITVRLWAWYQWGVLFLLVLWLGNRYPLTAERWRRSVPIHLGLSVVIGVFQIAVNTWTHLAFVADPAKGNTYFGYLQSLLLFAFHRNLLIYWGAIGAQAAFRTYQKLREEEIAGERLRSQLVEARLDALKMQLHPHFLFNTLHAVTALVRRDPRRAESMIQDLSEMLRLTLADVDAQRVPLAREIEILDRYFAIQKVRFGDRLNVELDIAPEALPLQVPNLLLQPLVENAIRYGVASRYRGGRVRVEARLVAGRVALQVRDDGPGLDGSPERALRAGIGLSNTRERLQQLYGDDHTFAIANDPEGGLVVTVDLPAGPAVLREPEPLPALESRPGEEAA